MRPRRLRFPDDRAEDVSKSWRCIQSETVKWLVETRLMTSCPIKNKQGTILVNDTATSTKGVPFKHSMEVCKNFWINTNFGPADHLRKAREVLLACGVDPKTVRLEFD